MIYFLTDWQGEEQLELDAIFNVTKTFNISEVETKIINTKLLPFSSYFANSFEFYNPNKIINLLDTVAHQVAATHAPLNLSDLHFPQNWEKTFTRTNVLLSENGVIKGEVFFNKFGFVSEVHYPSQLGNEIHVYSEKGHILSKQKISSSGEQIENQVFDEGGKLIFTDWSDYVFIGETYKNYFARETYATFKDLFIELLNTTLTNFNSVEDRIIVDGTSSWLMDIVEGFSFPETALYVFSGELGQCIDQIDKHRTLIEKGKRIITDNHSLQKRIENDLVYQSLKNVTRYMPLYPTTLTLGKSNTYLEQSIYWQINHFDVQSEKILLDFLRLKLEINDLYLIIDMQNNADQVKVQRTIESFISQNLGVDTISSDYLLVKQYYEALEKEEMTPELDNLFSIAKEEQNLEFSKALEAYAFFTCITFRNFPSVQELRQDFTKMRIFIDYRDENQFHSHSLALSAGIPILSKKASPYLNKEKNGVVFQNNEQLIRATDSYLSNTDKWNQNLVESVDIIQKYSMDGLIIEWKEYLK
ncbi:MULTISPECIES: accessory Sec system glycosyltransferase Asp1 [Lactococcus]|uniref:Accessory secretory protein Asp1 n=1 Tax=Lactococcus lactis subsp. cremoris TaxID=1359 RepID=A0A166KKA4_LACLC|nr:accessory Sec system glycosyltransferase Asp1 [Lactococcus cremoris]KZK08513.1 Accessory secretory protein Asp1 [Lactococcus cremoris]